METPARSTLGSSSAGARLPKSPGAGGGSFLTLDDGSSPRLPAAPQYTASGSSGSLGGSGSSPLIGGLYAASSSTTGNLSSSPGGTFALSSSGGGEYDGLGFEADEFDAGMRNASLDSALSGGGGGKGTTRPARSSRGSRLGAQLSKGSNGLPGPISPSVVSMAPPSANNAAAPYSNSFFDASRRAASASPDARGGEASTNMAGIGSGGGRSGFAGIGSGAVAPPQPVPNPPFASSSSDTEPRKRGNVAAMAARWGAATATNPPSPGKPPAPSPTRPLFTASNAPLSPPLPAPVPGASSEQGRLSSAFGLSSSTPSSSSTGVGAGHTTPSVSAEGAVRQNGFAALRKTTLSSPSPVRREPEATPGSSFDSSAHVYSSPPASPIPGPPQAKRRLSRASSHGNLLTSLESSPTSSAAPSAAPLAQAAAQNAPPSAAVPLSQRPGRLSRLQYNKPDSLGRSWDATQRVASVSGASGGSPVASSAARPSLLTRTSTPNLAGEFRRAAPPAGMERYSVSPGGSPVVDAAAGHAAEGQSPGEQRRVSTTGPAHRELLLPALTGVGGATPRSWGASTDVTPTGSALGSRSSSAAHVLAHAREDLQLAAGEADESTELQGRQEAGRWSRSHAAQPSMDTSESGNSATSGTGSATLHRSDTGKGASASASKPLPKAASAAHRLSERLAPNAQPGGAHDEAEASPKLGDSPRIGMLSDADILAMGAVPGASHDPVFSASAAPLSSKNVLTIALQKAQSAVLLDSANNVPEAIAAYKQAVRLLQEVMERIAPRNSKKSRSSREEERRRLRVIHDTYADRIRLLSMIYSPGDSSGDDEEDEEDTTPDDSHSVSQEPSSALDTPSVESRAAWPTYDSSIDSGVVSSPRPDSSESSVAFPKAFLQRSSAEQVAASLAAADAGTPTAPLDSAVTQGNVAASSAASDASQVTARSSFRLSAPRMSGEASGLAQQTPSISIAPEPPRTSDDQEVLLDGAAKKTHSRTSGAESEPRSRSDSGGSYQSASGAGNLRIPDSLYARQQAGRAFGIDEEVKTPATPYFDIDPNLILSTEIAKAPGDGELTPASAASTLKSPYEQHMLNYAGAAEARTRVHSQRSVGSRAAGSMSAIPSPRLQPLQSGGPHDARMERRPSSEGNGETLAAAAAAAAAMEALSRDLTSPTESVQTPDSQSRFAGIRPRAITIARSDAAMESKLLVSPTVATGTISQRRNKGTLQPPGANAQSLTLAMPDGSPQPSPLATPTMEALELDHDGTRRPRGRDSNGAEEYRPLDSAGRKRASSQPSSKRPSIPAAFMNQGTEGGASVPPMPRIARKSSAPGSPGPNGGLRAMTQRDAEGGGTIKGSTLSPAGYAFPRSSSPGYHALEAPSSPTPSVMGAPEPWNGRVSKGSSPSFAALFPASLPSAPCGSPSFATGTGSKPMVLPWLGVGGAPESSSLPPPPNNPALRPFHMMRQLHLSIVRGAFVTRRLYIPKELWVQQGAKLLSLEAKIRMLEVAATGIDGLEKGGEPLLVPPGGQPGLAVVNAARFAKQLEDFAALLVEVQNSLAKKLSFLDTVAGKKANTSLGMFGSKLTRSLDRMTSTSKGSDSPASYIEALARLFSRSQVIGSHLHALLRAKASPNVSDSTESERSPSVEAYAALPAELRTGMEAKLRLMSDFFANVVLRVVLRDLSILLDKSSKRANAALID